MGSNDISFVHQMPVAEVRSETEAALVSTWSLGSWGHRSLVAIGVDRRGQRDDDGLSFG